MTTYIALFNLTDAGIKAAKDSPRRLDAAKKLLAEMGGEMKQFYMVRASSTLSESARRRTTPSWPATSCSSGASASCARKR